MKKQVDDKPYTTAANVEKYETLKPLLEAMFHEFGELSKKKPDGALNKRKVELVNRLLRDVLVFLDGEPSRTYLDPLNEDDLPQNSDVLLMLSQFVAAMKAFHNKYYGWDEIGYENTWRIK